MRRLPRWSRRPRPASSSSLGRHGLDVDDAGPRLHDAGDEGEVLAHRVPLEVARQVDVAQAGVALEGEAEHLPALALVPVGAVVDGTQLGTVEVVAGDVGLDDDVACWSATFTTRAKTWKRVSPPATPVHDRRRGRPARARRHAVVLVAAVGRGQPVDGRQEVEPAHAEVVAGDLAGGAPGVGGDPHPEGVAHGDVGVDDGVAELGREAVAEGLAGLVARLGRGLGRLVVGGGRRCQVTTIGSPFQRSAGSSVRMRSCRSTMPSSRASGRGGQPGT